MKTRWPTILFLLCKEHVLFVLFSIIMLFISGFLQALSVISLAPIFDVFIQEDLTQGSTITIKVIEFFQMLDIQVSMFSIIALMLLLITCKNIFLYLSEYTLSRFAIQILENIRKGLFQSFLKAKWEFFLNNNYGYLGSTLLRETEKASQTLETMSKLISNSIRGAFLLGTALLISWEVTLIMIGLTGLLMFPFMFLGKWGYKLMQIHNTANNNMFGVVSESFTAAKLILGFGNQERSYKQLARIHTSASHTALKWVMIRLIPNRFMEPISILIVSICIYIGSRNFGLEAASLAVMLFSLKSCSQLAVEIVNQKNSLNAFGASLEQVYNLKSDADKMYQASGSVQFSTFADQIVFDKIEFGYSKNEPVIQQLNLIIPKGKMIAIVGESGTGKTTVIDLLMGFYVPDKGKIFIDSKDLSEFDLNSWRRKIGFVPQDVFLFHQTIRDNLLWSNSEASEQEIQAACVAAHASEFIDNLPDKLETMVGDRGIRLSGGQRQRIALARALLRKPEILILDEATSALDSHSEKLIQKAIEEVSKYTTIVSIAHRLSTIQNADIIYVMDKGKIIESGNFENLLQIDSGIFMETAELQGLGRLTSN
jgi:ABC-type multidrug transport system fused ATPase/permease subunit